MRTAGILLLITFPWFGFPCLQNSTQGRCVRMLKWPKIHATHPLHSHPPLSNLTAELCTLLRVRLGTAGVLLSSSAELAGRDRAGFGVVGGAGPGLDGGREPVDCRRDTGLLLGEGGTGGLAASDGLSASTGLSGKAGLAGGPSGSAIMPATRASVSTPLARAASSSSSSSSEEYMSSPPEALLKGRGGCVKDDRVAVGRTEERGRTGEPAGGTEDCGV